MSERWRAYESWHASPRWTGNSDSFLFLISVSYVFHRLRCVNVWFILDSLQSTLSHGIINSSRVDTFRRQFSEGSLYSLSGFDVGRSNPKSRLSDSLVSIRFNDGTFFETKTDSDKDIPTELFRFRSQEQLLTLANTNKELPGISLLFNKLIQVSSFTSISVCYFQFSKILLVK